MAAKVPSQDGGRKTPIWPGSPFRGSKLREGGGTSVSLAEKYYREVVVKEPQHRKELVDILLLDEDATTAEKEVYLFKLVIVCLMSV